MHVFLTGATGFIGSHVARVLLREGCRVTALVRPDSDRRRIADIQDVLQFIEGDFCEVGELGAKLRADVPDAAIHLAWYAVPGKYLNAAENLACVAGSLELLKALDEAGCPRTVMAGTCFEYDTEAGYLSEETPARPRSIYAASKHGLYLIAEQYQKRQKRSFAWARIFYQYGPWEDERRLVPAVVRRLLDGEPCALSHGRQIRDFLHIEDVAGALWAIARSPLEGAVNIGSGRPVRVADIANTIGELTGRPDLLRFGQIAPNQDDPPFVCANVRRLGAEAAWSPKFDLTAGLSDCIAWWKTNGRLSNGR